MRISKRKVHLLVFSVTTICIIVVAAIMLCPKPVLPPPDVTSAIANAIPVFEGSGDPYALLFLDVLYRRFGIEEFSNALQRYDQVIADAPDDPMLRLFRRIADYDTPLQTEDFDSVISPYDQITIPALYCDLVGVPPNYLTILENSVAKGDYRVTHVLLALIWMEENNYEMELPDGFAETVYSANAALIDDSDIEVYDIELEAAAFLCLAGQEELIDDNFVRCVIDSQIEDGSWGHSTERWHTTVLGLTFLLHFDSSTKTYPPMLDR
jgi:hypothetical protein